ncbi:DNA polymerase-3 subunit gamma/tau [Verrucomicrobium sp. GAS474]|uniref:DNA polymerase III subunit gamma/tau n=1 Tax=Verrucomicrobium sp. GAS474 TaxID=1882831 RepID=UPI000879608C|nr:DNA polymerase III subunit gamma/tau [Verrucomicrobium sp. GAS474]SDU02372.1 DNA polymerase-3 subunit gamma/tau [Verrucomicrobium sp. GAS474]
MSDLDFALTSAAPAPAPAPYQVFARKYRPRTFAEVIGQEHITRTLSNAIGQGRLAQAYLLVGPRGTGKTSTARIIAKALNAPGGPQIDFDPDSEIAKEIAEGRCMDVLEIDGASNNGVEQVRDLRDNVRFAPTKGRFKIYIIDEVHMLTSAAFNALLKTLEEPPAHVKFIFATTEVHKVPATVLSRCQRFDFRRIPDAAIVSHLGHICAKEGATAEEGALRVIARHADGGLRDAEVALDQVIGFFGNRVEEAAVLEMFGLTGIGPVADLARAIVHGDASGLLRQSRSLAAAGKDITRLAHDLLKFFRDFALWQTAPEAVEAELAAGEKEAFSVLAANLTPRGTIAILEELGTLEGRLRYALSKDVLFEVTLLQLSQLRERVSIEAILHRLGGAAEAGSFSAAAPAATVAPVPAPASRPAPAAAAPIPAPAPVPAAAAVPAPSPVPEAVPAKKVDPAKVWARAVAQFAQERPLEAASIATTRVAEMRGDEIEIALPANLKHKIAAFMSPRNIPILQEVLRAEFGRPVGIVFLAIDEASKDPALIPAPVAAPTNEPPAPSNAAPAPGASAPLSKEPIRISEKEYKDDPLIRKALDLFQARVVSTKNS